MYCINTYCKTACTFGNCYSIELRFSSKWWFCTGCFSLCIFSTWDMILKTTAIVKQIMYEMYFSRYTFCLFWCSFICSWFFLVRILLFLLLFSPDLGLNGTVMLRMELCSALDSKLLWILLWEVMLGPIDNSGYCALSEDVLYGMYVCLVETICLCCHCSRLILFIWFSIEKICFVVVSV